MSGVFVPAPARAPLGKILASQTAMEVRLTLRHGESLLLTMVIPLLLLVGATKLSALSLPSEDRVGYLTPGILALAVMSTAFTGQAIATGFERSYGVLKRLGASPLPRWALLVAKTLGLLAILLVQVVLLSVVAVALGWRPFASGVIPALALVVLGTAAFSGLGLLMAGTLRPHTTLAGANLLYLLLLAGGGVIVPLTSAPAPVRAALDWLPITALVDGLRAVLADGVPAPARAWVALLVWALLGIAGAARFFTWE